MTDLPQDLEVLRELSESRWRAKELREQAIYALKQIECKDPRPPRDSRESPFKDKKRVQDGGIDFERWVAGNDDVEIALLVKVQNHRDISVSESENNGPRNASDRLKETLTNLGLAELLQPSSETGTRSRFPVLLAARAMQALVTRAETVFEPATMYCYYRIIRELYGVAHPNWTIGAARAGIGGTTSAFVTNECIRAIFAFERALERTYKFLEQTCIFCEYFSSLRDTLDEWKIGPESPLTVWANKSIEAMWLDCQIATNPRNREMALFHSIKSGKGNVLLLPDGNRPADLKRAGKYFDSLQGHLEKAVDRLLRNVSEVHATIEQYRLKEETPGKYQFSRPATGGTEKERKKERARDEKVTHFIRSATAHAFALKVIENAVENARDLRDTVRKGPLPRSAKAKRERTKEILGKMAKKFYTIRRRVHHVLEPSKQYLKWVLGRELAAPRETFDAGELVFAATSYGAINNWRLDDRLNRACELLISSLPGNGRLPTKRPFHADPRGYRTIPIGCEMTRALATLLQKAGYDFDPNFVGRMLGVFEEQLIELQESTAEKTLVGWNFEGAPSPEKPAVWVTAVSVLALDRIVRMLNTRINEIVLAHFDVANAKRPHTQLTLRDLIYSDYALVKRGFHKDEEQFTAIHVQKARAHVMRATLPRRYREDNKNFSTIYYGPPHTGKTTLAESLALSAGVPLLRLSPGDLILQGQELIEGRAHDVFEALSMLAQCVIIFDEFEPVLKNRGNETRSSSSEDGLGRIGDILQAISNKDDPKFRFVLGGMLPKLIKLHDSAEKQSFAYCLGTNRLADIDRAAKRKGRFDKRIPVYKPDPLSRAGALLYWLGQAEKIQRTVKPLKKAKDTKEKELISKIQRFTKIIGTTIGEPADRISKFVKVKKSEDGKGHLTKTLKYVLGIKQQALHRELEKCEEKLDALKKETPIDKDACLDEGENEKGQREWIHKYEGRFVKAAIDIDRETTRKNVIRCLNEHLALSGRKRKKQRAK